MTRRRLWRVAVAAHRWRQRWFPLDAGTIVWLTLIAALYVVVTGSASVVFLPAGAP